MLYHTARLDHSLGHPLLCVWACSQAPGLLFYAGSGMLNSHSMPANGEMNGGHSSQTMVSGSHCTPPPPYHADPSLVRFVVCGWSWVWASSSTPHPMPPTVCFLLEGAALHVALADPGF